MASTLVEEFFRAPRQPVSTHEEWLLRLCAQLMEREARAVSVLEAQAAVAAAKQTAEVGVAAPPIPAKKRTPRRRNRCSSNNASTKPSSDALAAPIDPSTATERTSWADSS